MAPRSAAGAAPREPLSTERVLRTALALADSGGAEALTMRRLGQELGVEAMSLYKHVANKDAILDGIVDLVVGEISVPSPEDDWKAAMRRRGISAHEVLLRHPWACRLLMSRPHVGPAMLRYVDSTLGSLREAGFSIEQADRAWSAMDSHIYGFTLQRLNFPFEVEQFPEAAATHLPQLPPGRYPHLTEMAVHVMEGTYDGAPDFVFGLDLILDGLERMVAGA
ncbi:TetR/AcrR family transcriptional regulator [Streptomyces sp. NPDC006208]|uniref:TetR/AcrR family transcriptional regulator n=1 Tax=Streptomyces sp. NPDC006208 TaxID=3156734 RepID=UPI0033B23CB8